MVRIVPFAPEHLNEVERRGFEEAALMKLGDLSARAAMYMQYGPAFTGVADGVVIGCAGVVTHWEGVGEAWAFISTAAAAHPLGITKAVKGWLDAQKAYRRIQANVKADDERAVRWIRLLGFENEGLMRAFGPDGTDFRRFVRLYGG